MREEDFDPKQVKIIVPNSPKQAAEESSPADSSMLMQMLKGFGYGSADSLTLGAAPKLSAALSGSKELSGAGKSLLDLVHLANYDETTDPDIKAYNDAKTESLKNFNDAYSDAPASYIAGQIGSAFFPGAVFGGLSKLPEGASLAQKMWAGAKTGGAFGAAHGMFSGDQDKIEQRMVDSGIEAGKDALGGAAVAGVLHGLGKLMPEMKQAYDMGDRDVLYTKDGRRAIVDIERQASAEKLADKDIYGPGGIFKKTGDLYNKARAENENTILTAPFAKNLYGFADKITGHLDQAKLDKQDIENLISRYTKKAREELEDRPTENLLANSALKLKHELSEMSKVGQNQAMLRGDEGRNAASNAAGYMRDLLHKFHPNLEDADEKYHLVKEGFLAPLGIKEMKYPQDRVGIINKLKDDLVWGDADNKTGSGIRGWLDRIQGNLNNVEEGLGDKIVNYMQEKQGRFDITRAAGSEYWNGKPDLWKIFGSAKYQGANAAGSAGGFLSKYPAKFWSGVGIALQQTPSEAAQKLGKILIEGSQRDDAGRNALLFTLMQNGVYRDIINGLFSLDQQDKSAKQQP